MELCVVQAVCWKSSWEVEKGTGMTWSGRVYSVKLDESLLTGVSDYKPLTLYTLCNMTNHFHIVLVGEGGGDINIV